MGNIINVRDLDDEDVEIVERLVERLREKTVRRRKADEADPFKRSAGSWRGLIDADELIRNIYADREVFSRSVAKL